jgi:hypothetical protein
VDFSVSNTAFAARVLKSPAARILAVLIIFALAFATYELISRPWIRQWGTQEDETTRALTGEFTASVHSKTSLAPRCLT